MQRESVLVTREKFRQVPEETSVVPFWFWNKDLRKTELKLQLVEMKSQGVLEAMIHARRGLEIEYLSEEWFDRVEFTLQESRKMGLKMWVYDEDNWPSGYAGGRVLKVNPDYRGKCLHMMKMKAEDLSTHETNGHVIAVVAGRMVDQRIEPSSLRDITSSVLETGSWLPLEGDWIVYVFVQRYISWKPAYSEERYVDLIDPAAVKCFIDLTYEEYARRFGEYFGNTLKGFFTDEPGFYNNFHPPTQMDPHTVTWTTNFSEEFMKRKGYSINLYLPGLWEEFGDFSRQVRIDYFDVLGRMYEEYFFKQLYDWCDQHGVLLTGHVNDEEHMKYRIRGNAQYFRTMKYLHIPGIDKITRDTIKITEKLGSSAAHVYGHNICMSETYANSGWDLTLQEMKAVADWQYVRGINMMVPHAFYYSIEGDRMWECPPSQFFQNPYWKYFNLYSDYMRRLGYILSRGHHVANVAVYYPVVSGWRHLTPDNEKKVDEIDQVFKELSYSLLEAQLDFDYLDDDTLWERARIEDGCIKVLDESYKALVIPRVSVLPLRTVRFLKRFVESGGSLVMFESPEVQGASLNEDEEVADLMQELLGSVEDVEDQTAVEHLSKGRAFVASGQYNRVASILKSIGGADIVLCKPNPSIKYLHRKARELDVYFIINESCEPCDISVDFHKTGLPQIWNAETGEVCRIAHESSCPGWTRIDLQFPSFGSCLVVFDSSFALDSYMLLPAIEDGYPGSRVECVLDGEFEIEIDSKSFTSELKSLTELGFGYFSGEVKYRKEFHLDRSQSGGRLFLDLGVVKETAEVVINGHDLGSRVWAPYVIDITDALKSGKNTVEIIVTNTLENSLSRKALAFGLMGPVRIFSGKAKVR